ncbi:MAG: DNA mismatch repair protein MutS, partial [Alphaproteobacteria bacterium]|nr:DNA mismatch repair protein MutS [Alphaproteobacteria bacterium]
STLRDALGTCPDIERPLGRLSLERGGPRDLAAIRDGLACAATLRGVLDGDDSSLMPLPEGLTAAASALGEHRALIDRLDRALAPDLPLLTRDGNFVASGYNAVLDEQRTLRDESRRLIAALQARYRDETGIAGLKVRHNNVLGYFIEVGTSHGDALLGDERFVHRQTMASAVRFTSGELAELDDKIARAGERVLALELELFDDLRQEVDARAAEIATAARAIAEIDVAAALAELAMARDYCRPRVDDSLAFRIDKGRHPVVEAILAEGDAAGFVANDCELGDDSRLWLLSGPNMAGKSTFLRQNALFAVLAQAGSFVPAAAAHIGVVDRLFSRVGASDDLARGRSTFMVEMIETAAILNQAGERALVILDEIGRGTATYDGLSIAWATIEHLHDSNTCRGLFATHYHELTNLAARLDRLACHTMRVREWEGEAIFLYEVGPGAADRSYGIHVARLAGLPVSVVARASEVLALLESDESQGVAARLADDLPLFAASRPPPAQPPSPALEALSQTELDDLSPRQALELLYRLKTLVDGED